MGEGSDDEGEGDLNHAGGDGCWIHTEYNGDDEAEDGEDEGECHGEDKEE